MSLERNTALIFSTLANFEAQRARLECQKAASSTLRLQQEGVQKFADSFNQLINTISTKRQQMMAGV